MEEIDLGVCGGRRWPSDARRAAVVLPGARYSPASPLLWFARKAVQRHGWTVVEVWDEWKGGGDPVSWVEERARAALASVPDAEERLVVAKSISTPAAALAADLGLPAVWLTPLLKEQDVLAGLRRRSAPALLVGGTADPAWDARVARELEGAEVLELDGANHTLEIEDDPLASIDALRLLTERVDAFVGGLARRG